MKLNKATIRELYGEQLFVIPDSQPKESKTPEQETPSSGQEEEKPPSQAEVVESAAVEEPVSDPQPREPKTLQEGHPVQWKMRPTSTMALVLTASEFGNKLVTNGLKQLVLDAGINPKEIGFGVLEEGHETWDFSEMPVPVAVVFCPVQVKNNPVSLPAGKVHISYPVSEIVMDTNKQKALLKLFSTLV
jgi:hypothetical protein